jgi:uncharacterized protein (TIGR02001 family)
MKLYKIILSSAFLVATLPTVQAGPPLDVEITGNVALTSDYVFRGVSLSNENMAIQGEFDATHSSGAYIGTWASNVAGTNPGSVELDVYAGYSNEISGFGYNVFVTRFIYPGSGKDANGKDHQNLDYHEYSLALSYSLPTGTEFGLRYDYAPFWGRVDSQANNYLLSVSHPLPDGFSVGAFVGRQEFNDDQKINPNNNSYDDYTYYGASLSYSINDFTLSVDFSDTTIEAANGNDIDGTEDRFFFTLKKEF